jgi:Uma2 family endonuclease
MEVSDTSLRYDLKTKLPHFAAALIPEVWIQDVNADVVHVFQAPWGEAYNTSMQLKRGDSITPLAFPDIRFSMDDLLGPAARESTL